MSLPDGGRRLFLRGRFTSAPVPPLRPPWAVAEKLFSDLCSRCDECIQACAENILARGDGGYPEVRFSQGECTFCGECVKSCSKDALRFPVTDTGAWLAGDGKDAWRLEVRFASNCLSLNAIVCRACGDVCETGAIRFQLKPGGVAEPRLSAEDCSGCGACVRPCPVQAVSLIPSHPLPEGKPTESSRL